MTAAEIKEQPGDLFQMKREVINGSL